MKLSTISIRICYIVFAALFLQATFAVSLSHGQAVDASEEASLETGIAPVQYAYSPENGKPHPDFVLPSIEDGSPVRLSDFRGKKVLLLHFASW